jgi:hypothetical protein
MTRFLGMLVVLCAVAASIGYCRGWFYAESTDSGGQRAVIMTVDKDKFNQDKASLRQDVQDLGHK